MKQIVALWTNAIALQENFTLLNGYLCVSTRKAHVRSIRLGLDKERHEIVILKRRLSAKYGMLISRRRRDLIFRLMIMTTNKWQASREVNQSHDRNSN